jgi:hypothetical protein
MKTDAPKIAKQDETAMRKTLWDRFKLAGVARSFEPESFDYAAARLYVMAQDPPSVADHDPRVRRLIKRKQFVSVPLVVAFEEQDPRYGHIVLSTLTKEDYGEFQIVNHLDPRISSPQASIPPHELAIHLCWGTGFAGISESYSPDGRERIAYASILQGLVALLLDDWREALRLLPVKFCLHKMRPDHRCARNKIKGGRRWRYLKAEESTLPPEEVVGLLFERANAVSVSLQRDWLIDQKQSSDRNWWCGCVLRCDLRELGFREKRSGFQQGGGYTLGWEAERSALPGGLSHVIVIDEPAGQGNILRVHSSPGGLGRMALYPMRRYHYLAKDDDYSFCALRKTAMNLVLDELQARLA